MKLFFHEHGSLEARQAVDQAEGLATSQITLVETRSALATAVAIGRIDKPAQRTALREFGALWAVAATIDVTVPILGRAADLAESHVLRAYGAVHLASSLLLRDKREEVSFACWDLELRAAAQAERVELLPAAPGP